MSNKVYVGNLSYNLTEETLTEEFSEAGNVISVKIVRDMETGRSKGFAFVEMETEEEAKNAIECMNGKEINGRQLRVDSARDNRESKGRGEGRGSREGRGGYNNRRNY